MPVAIDIPDVPGDPAGMRALAAGLRSDAQAVGAIGSALGCAATAGAAVPGNWLALMLV